MFLFLLFKCYLGNSESFVQHPGGGAEGGTKQQPWIQGENFRKILVSCGVEILRDPLASKEKGGELWEGRDIRDFHHVLHPRAGGGWVIVLIPNSKYVTITLGLFWFAIAMQWSIKDAWDSLWVPCSTWETKSRTVLCLLVISWGCGQQNSFEAQFSTLAERGGTSIL